MRVRAREVGPRASMMVCPDQRELAGSRSVDGGVFCRAHCCGAERRVRCGHIMCHSIQRASFSNTRAAHFLIVPVIWARRGGGQRGRGNGRGKRRRLPYQSGTALIARSAIERIRAGEDVLDLQIGRVAVEKHIPEVVPVGHRCRSDTARSLLASVSPEGIADQAPPGSPPFSRDCPGSRRRSPQRARR